jgi:hypothetical protein
MLKPYLHFTKVAIRFIILPTESSGSEGGKILLIAKIILSG